MITLLSDAAFSNVIIHHAFLPVLLGGSWKGEKEQHSPVSSSALPPTISSPPSFCRTFAVLTPSLPLLLFLLLPSLLLNLPVKRFFSALSELGGVGRGDGLFP